MADFIDPDPRCLSEQRVCIAVDISGSTAGAVLRSEVDAINQVSAFLSYRPGSVNPNPLTVLPWSSTSYTAIPLPSSYASLAYIYCEGGTDPSCIYTNDTYLKALKECSAWFLFTDGIIDTAEVESFSVSTTDLGLHGTTCIVVVFGSAAAVLPASTNCSVGISTYALAPNSLFLFHDTSTGTVYLLQAKGCFEVLLASGTGQPTLDDQLRWPQVPRITYRDLAAIIIPPPQALSEDERVLRDGLVIRLKDIYDGTASQETLQRVARPENMSSLVMGEVSRGMGANLSNSLKTLSNKLLPKALPRHRNYEGDLSKAMTRVLRALREGLSEDVLHTYRLKLKQVYDTQTTDLPRVAEHSESNKRTRTLYKNLTRASQQSESMSYSHKQANAHTASNSFVNYCVSESEEEDNDRSASSEEDEISERPRKMAKTVPSTSKLPGPNGRRAGLRSLKNHAAPSNDFPAISRSNSMQPSEDFQVDVSASSRNAAPQSRFDGASTSKKISASPFDTPDSSDFLPTVTPASASPSHPPIFEGKCDLCLRQRPLSLLVLGSRGDAGLFTVPHEHHTDAQVISDATIRIPLSEIFWDNACCSACISYLNVELENPMFVKIRVPHAEFKLRTGAANLGERTGGPRTVAESCEEHGESQESFLCVFNWEANVEWIGEIHRDSTFKCALLWLKEELENGPELLQ